MSLAEYIEVLRADGLIVEPVRMNPPPDEGLDVVVELYPEPTPFVEFFGNGQLVARAVLGW